MESSPAGRLEGDNFIGTLEGLKFSPTTGRLSEMRVGGGGIFHAVFFLGGGETTGFSLLAGGAGVPDGAFL